MKPHKPKKKKKKKKQKQQRDSAEDPEFFFLVGKGEKQNAFGLCLGSPRVSEIYHFFELKIVLLAAQGS